MRKQKNLFFMLKESKVCQVAICIALMTIIMSVYVLTNEQIKTSKTMSSLKKMESGYNYSVISKIENIEEKGNEIVISGNVIRNGVSVEKLFLILQSNGREFFFETEFEVEKQRDKSIENKWEGQLYRFYVNIGNDELISENCYEILLGLRENIGGKDTGKIQVEKIHTNSFLYQNQIHTVDASKIVSPCFSDAWISTVIEDGRICAYNDRFPAWVYCYEGALYWIFSDEYCRELEEMYIPLHISTFLNKDLPEYSRQDGFENKDFNFFSHEYEMSKAEKYRVACVELPKEYPITYVSTGIYDRLAGKWVWSETFQLYEFEK